MSSFLEAYAVGQSFLGAALVGAALLGISLVVALVRDDQDNRWVSGTLFVIGILWVFVSVAWDFIFPPDMAMQLLGGRVYDPAPATQLVAKFFGLVSGAAAVQAVRLWLSPSRY